MEKEKRLYKSEENKMISGVCGGLGEYFETDPTLIRLLWVVLSLFVGIGFLGLIAYIIAAIIIPKKSNQ